MASASSRALYDNIIRAVHSRGFHAVILPGDYLDSRVVCAETRHDRGGMSGTSFWLVLKDDVWYLGTWIERFWMLPTGIDVPRFCIEYLESARPSGYHAVPESILQQYTLKEITPDTFCALFVGTWVPYVLRALSDARNVCMHHGQDVPHDAEQLLKTAIRIAPKEEWTGKLIVGKLRNLPCGYTINMAGAEADWRATAQSCLQKTVYSIDTNGNVCVT